MKNPLAKIGKGLFIAESSFLVLDLIGNPINSQVTIFGERNVVLFPDLTELFGHKLLKDFAVVVFAFSLEIFHIGFRAKGLSIGEKSDLLIGVGAEAESHARAATGAIKLADIGHNLSRSGRHIDHLFIGEAPDIVVGISHGVVAVDHHLEKSSHFFYLLISCF